MYSLIHHRPQPKKYHQLSSPITIGRASKNQVVLRERSISRKHCRIFEQNGKLFLEDLKSANGTYIEGKPVLLRRIEIGVPFSVGNQRLTLLLENAEAESFRKNAHTLIPARHWLERSANHAGEHWLKPAPVETTFSKITSKLTKQKAPKRPAFPRKKRVPVLPKKSSVPLFLGIGSLCFLGLLLCFNFLFRTETPPEVKPLTPKDLLSLRQLPPNQRPHFAPTTYQVLLRGIDYLLRHQQPDGSWHPTLFLDQCQKENRCSGHGESYHITGLTALGVLVLLAEGADEDFRYREPVHRGIQYLIKTQQSDGLFGEKKGKYTYNHALATLALAEAVTLRPEESWKRPLQKAINWILQSQNEDGGWRYGLSRQDRSDLSVTGWMVSALWMAKQTQMMIPESALKRAQRFIESCIIPETGAGFYQTALTQNRTSASETMTAVAAIQSHFFSFAYSEKSIVYLSQTLPAWAPAKINYYYWYQMAYALYWTQPERFSIWFNAFGQIAVGAQEKQGCAKGSFAPLDSWSKEGGRLYATMFTLLTLQSAYRYHPEAPWEVLSYE